MPCLSRNALCYLSVTRPVCWQDGGYRIKPCCSRAEVARSESRQGMCVVLISMRLPHLNLFGTLLASKSRAAILHTNRLCSSRCNGPSKNSKSPSQISLNCHACPPSTDCSPRRNIPRNQRMPRRRCRALQLQAPRRRPLLSRRPSTRYTPYP